MRNITNYLLLLTLSLHHSKLLESFINVIDNFYDAHGNVKTLQKLSLDRSNTFTSKFRRLQYLCGKQ